MVVDGGEDCWAVLYVQWVIGRKHTFVRSCPVNVAVDNRPEGERIQYR